MQVGVIGLGSIGLGFARSILRAGHDVTGFDVRDERLKLFSSSGGKISPSAAEAVERADCVMCVVINAAQTEEVLFGAGGVAEAMPEGSVFVSCATVPPEAAIKLADRLEAGVRLYIDAPTSGGPADAEAGRSTIMASGSEEAFARAEPALQAAAKKVYRLGEKAGAGSAMKIINQLLAGVHIATACEAITFAIRLGLDPAQAYEVIINAAGTSWMFADRVRHVLDGDYAPKAAVNIFTKDLGIILDSARTANFPVPMASMALQMFQMAATAGMGGDDDSSVARVYAQLAGLPLPKPAKKDA